MDRFIDNIGNQTCSFIDQIGLYKLKLIIGWNTYDNYSIGLYTIIFLLVLISGGFFGFFNSQKN